MQRYIRMKKTRRRHQSIRLLRIILPKGIQRGRSKEYG